MRRRWRAAVLGLGLAVLAAWWSSPYIFSVYHLQAGASALDEALLPVYPDRLAPEQVLDWQKIQDASAHLREALRWDGRNVQAQRLLARVYLSIGEPQAALQALQAALVARPDNPLLWLEVGDVYDSMGNTQAAIEAYRAGRVGSRAVPLVANYLVMAEAQMEWGSGEVAIALWREVLDLDPGNLYALCQLGYIHHEVGDMESAAASEQKLKDIDPRSVGLPLDFRLAEYQALAMVRLVEDGTWERQTLLGVISRHVGQADGELLRLMAGRELETILAQWPEDGGALLLKSTLQDSL